MPQINSEMHFFIKEKELWGICLSNSTPLREIDFDEEEWRQDCQFVIDPIDTANSESMDHKAIRLFDFKPHLEENEIVLPHCIVKINKFKIIVFPLKDSK